MADEGSAFAVLGVVYFARRTHMKNKSRGGKSSREKESPAPGGAWGRHYWRCPTQVNLLTKISRNRCWDTLAV